MSASPTWFATFCSSDHRARFGTKKSCSSGSSGFAFGTPLGAATSSSNRSLRRFRKRSPKMKFL
ncbi:hypothetical protein WMF31_35040 [Sorangium sp. So ce1036]